MFAALAASSISSCVASVFRAHTPYPETTNQFVGEVVEILKRMKQTNVVSDSVIEENTILPQSIRSKENSKSGQMNKQTNRLEEQQQWLHVNSFESLGECLDHQFGWNLLAHHKI